MYSPRSHTILSLKCYGQQSAVPVPAAALTMAISLELIVQLWFTSARKSQSVGAPELLTSATSAELTTPFAFTSPIRMAIGILTVGVVPSTIHSHHIIERHSQRLRISNAGQRDSERAGAGTRNRRCAHAARCMAHRRAANGRDRLIEGDHHRVSATRTTLAAFYSSWAPKREIDIEHAAGAVVYARDRTDGSRTAHVCPV